MVWPENHRGVEGGQGEKEDSVYFLSRGGLWGVTMEEKGQLRKRFVTLTGPSDQGTARRALRESSRVARRQKMGVGQPPESSLSPAR